MTFFKHFATYALGCLIACSVHADEIILERSDDDQIVIEINSEDSFLTILEWIRDQFKTPKQIREENEIIALNDISWDAPDELTFDLSFLNKITVSKPSKSKNKRNYAHQLTQKEKDDISYILKTLNDHTFVTLAAHRSALKKAGERVDHVHPLRFLQCIFTDEDLKVCVRNIQGKIFVWGEFLKGITTSLTEETKKNNVPPEQIVDFAATLGIDVGAIYSLYINQNWEQLVDVLINVVPRKDPSDRYNI